ncbi:MAG TPA: ABC transporter substrate-binding protein [Jatrophihabitans sp.]|jgi:peptide/nickel transport system substrate-binding protein|nr:ABC transporter substrate-binding protein [Jatrophihabitans sp.]
MIRSHVAALAALAIAALGVSSCAGANNDTGGGSSTLTIQGDAGDPTLTENFNPYSSTQLEGTRLIYEPLEIASSVDGSYTPFLATSFATPDPTTVTFTLRDGVTWSDGKPFSAADVVFTFNLLKKNAALDLTGVWSQLSSVTSSGNTVTMKMNAPNVPFAATLAAVPIVPEHLWKSVSDPTKFSNTKPVGTGPFMLDKFAPTEYRFKKNDSYWQADKIAPTQVVFPAQSTNQSTNQLDVTSGKFDWSYNFLPDVQKTYVSRDPEHNHYWFPPGGTIGLFLNLTKTPYNDVNFRSGISLALQRDTIAQKAVNGYTTAASSSGLILPNLKKDLDPSLPDQGVIQQDTSAALKAFGQAGYTMQGGKLVKDGKQAAIKLEMPNNFTDWVAAATEVKTQLAKVGVAVTLDEPQYEQYEKDIGSGSFDAAMGGFGGSGSPYTDFNNMLNSKFAAPLGTQTLNNFERFKDPAVDQALAQLAAATSKDAQLQATYKLEQIMYREQPIVLMYYGGSWGLFSTKRFTGWPSSDDPYMLPTTYNNAMLVVVTHLQKA